MTRAERDRVHCPRHLELLGHFARVTIERDSARAGLADLKASREGWSQAHDKLLEIVSRELTGDPEALRRLPCVHDQHDDVIGRIRAIREAARRAPGVGASE